MKKSRKIFIGAVCMIFAGLMIWMSWEINWQSKEMIALQKRVIILERLAIRDIDGEKTGYFVTGH